MSKITDKENINSQAVHFDSLLAELVSTN